MPNRKAIAIGFLATSTLIFETTLTRFLGVAQFYHFAFLVVSLALLGLGASGTILTIFPALKTYDLSRTLLWVGWGFSLSVGLAYSGVNYIPFDSFSIAWERIQILYFVLYYFVLSIPFMISGLGVGIALSIEGENHHLIYGSNLVGSAVGAMLTPVAQAIAGVPGTVLLCGLIGLSMVFILRVDGPRVLDNLARVSLAVGGVIFIILGVKNVEGDSPMGMVVSPYKGLSQARRYPGSESQFGAWNAVSRVDVFSDAGTHKLPGLSYQFPETPPDQLGLSVDAGPLQPITLVRPSSFQAAKWMPEWLPFSLNPEAEVLVINPQGGLGVLQALSGGAKEITAVVGNPLLLKAVAETGGSHNVYMNPKVQVLVRNERSFLQRTERTYDLLYFPLTDAYRPVTSGAFSLAEEYTLTTDSLQRAYQVLDPQGTLVISRWLQNPPSESLRTVVTLVKAGEKAGLGGMGDKLVIYRSVQTMTILVKPAGWDVMELKEVRSFLEKRRFDLVWAPDIDESEVNRHNQFPEPLYYQEVKAFLQAPDRKELLSRYPFDVSPPHDRHPFFFHYFTWAQTPQVLATLGRTWQPFGGSGYFVLLALLVMVTLLSAVLIIFPLLISPHLVHELQRGHARRALVYFAFLGFGFMMVEVPLIQRWILFLGYPIYAFAAVVGTLLFFSGWGSLFARQNWGMGKRNWAFVVLAALSLPILISLFSDVILGWTLGGRLAAVIVGLGPLGFLMGIPFPTGLSWVKRRVPSLAPWAWAVNGFTSVVASVIASLLALSAGYDLVFLVGVVAYLGAGVTYRGLPD